MSPAMLLGGGCLQSIYRNPANLRADASAIEALSFESPRRSVVAVGYQSAEDFASRLERAIARSNVAAVVRRWRCRRRRAETTD